MHNIFASSEKNMTFCIAEDNVQILCSFTFIRLRELRTRYAGSQQTLLHYLLVGIWLSPYHTDMMVVVFVRFCK